MLMRKLLWTHTHTHPHPFPNFRGPVLLPTYHHAHLSPPGREEGGGLGRRASGQGFPTSLEEREEENQSCMVKMPERKHTHLCGFPLLSGCPLPVLVYGNLPFPFETVGGMQHTAPVHCAPPCLHPSPSYAAWDLSPHPLYIFLPPLPGERRKEGGVKS